MEQYLIDQYNVFEDEKWLTDAAEIEKYFEDLGREYLDCGQGYYQDEADVICKIGDKFYEVNIVAEIGSAKQDRGDRLYWVESIDKVTYEEIEKPLPKESETVSYSLRLTKDQRKGLENYLNDNRIEFNEEECE